MAPSTRARSNSVKAALQTVPTPGAGPAPDASSLKPKAQPAQLAAERPSSFLSDLVTARWIVHPGSSFKLILLVAVVWAAFEHGPGGRDGLSNPARPLLFISYPLSPERGEDDTRYRKGTLDVAFVAFYFVLFSFLRQAVTQYIVRPIALQLGIKKEAKLQRFMEQGYGIFYWGFSGFFGMYVMSRSPTWWYDTKHFWLGFPHWRMKGELKWFYLTQFAYWIQQMAVLVLRLEKPRSDFFELVIHHFVTLWLVGWSYFLNLTMIGVAVFVSMDIPDVFFATSKCLSYLELEKTSQASFLVFMTVWHYMRHYLNFKILYSVWTEYDLIPEAARSFDTSKEGYWIPWGMLSGRMPPWMKYHIFAPIALLALLNIFWSVLIWRVLFNVVLGKGAKDTREEGEFSDEEGQEPKKSK